MPDVEAIALKYRCQAMAKPPHPMPRHTPPQTTSEIVSHFKYIAAIRLIAPAMASAMAISTNVLCTNSGLRYATNIVRKNVAQYARACERKNRMVTSGVWNSIGKNGNTPPHNDVALMVTNNAYPSTAMFGFGIMALLSPLFRTPPSYASSKTQSEP